MYQKCCNKCGSIDLYIKEKGNQTGLYCSDCGAWVKWLSKDEKRAFEHIKENEKRVNRSINLINQAIESAQCRIYRLKQNKGESIAHQEKAKNQEELMKITIAALKHYKDYLNNRE